MNRQLARILIVAGVLISTAVHGATGFKPTPEQERDAYAMLAGMSLKDMLAAHAEIVALNPEDRLAALQLTGGALNEKFELLLSEFVPAGKASKEQSILAMSIALMRLSHLAQASGLPGPSRCHLQESRAMSRMAMDELAKSPGCRSDLYTPEQQVAALEIGYGARGKSLNELANRWATKAIMFGLNGAKAELLVRQAK